MDDPPRAPPSLGQSLAGLPAGLRDVLQAAAAAGSSRVHLLALELRRARDVLPKIIALLVLGSVMALTAWVALWAAVAWLMVDLAGWAPMWAMALIAAINVVMAGLLAWRALAMVPLLALPATLRHLTTLRPHGGSETSP
ncbi:hypothetical protein V4F39_19875 [Aquincola sp. MAHUQ-54]|uniref:Phage holin family protein n=1 Tax=Aquincola agrisoli TaxID=3119538 RepID=A0AAW9Q866_9BURK